MYDDSLVQIEFEDMSYTTGDVVFYRHDAYLKFKGNNGNNYDVHVVKNVLKTIFSYFQPYYSHTGVIIVIDDVPYIYHLTADSQFDLISQSWVIGSPALVSLTEARKYPGFIYINKYVGPHITVDVNWLSQFSVLRLNGNLFTGLFSNLLKFMDHPTNEMVCTDFVMHVLHKLGISPKSKNPSINTVRNFISDGLYETRPILLKTGLFKALK
jgi:hypothetical protein